MSGDETGNETVVFPEPRSVVVEDRSCPDPGPGEVLVETDCSLVSTGTELTILSGEYPEESQWDAYGQYPFVPGYNNVGRVVAVGDGADLSAGDRVATWAPHARYVAVDAGDCRPVPEGIDDADAALFATAEIVMNGLRRGRVDWGERVAVFGLGTLGQLAVRLCDLAGAGRVVGFDLADERLGYLPDRPAVTGVNPADADPADAMADAGGTASAAGDGLADVVVEVTGDPAAIPQEVAALREQGRLVLLSSPHGPTEFDFHDHCNAPSIEIIGAHQTSSPSVSIPRAPWSKARHGALFFDLLADGRLAVDDLHTHAVAPAEAPDLYRELLADRTQAMAARIEW